MSNWLAKHKIYSYTLLILQQEIDSSLLACRAAPCRIAKKWDQNYEQFLCTPPPSNMG